MPLVLGAKAKKFRFLLFQVDMSAANYHGDYWRRD
jgi:hypothetical protein